MHRLTSEEEEEYKLAMTINLHEMPNLSSFMPYGRKLFESKNDLNDNYLGLRSVKRSL